MIKIKIHDPFVDRNEPTFRSLLFVKNILRDYSIDITESNDFDYMFIGMNDFINKDISLEDSIEWGLSNIDKISNGGDYFLFDGSDSTSLMASYEVLDQSNAKFLFKNQSLKNRDDYKKKTSFNKWFFGNGSDLDLGYDISEENWSRIKLSGWNLGYMAPQGFRPEVQTWHPVCPTKTIDLSAIYSGKHSPSSDHNAENASYYMNHRLGAWEVIGDNPGYTFYKDKLPYQEYIQSLYQSKMALSPFGQGEVCYRDFEIFEFGVAMIKPSMDKVNTNPNPYIENETYIPVDLDWKNLNEVVTKMLDSPDKLSYIKDNNRKVYDELYSANNLCRHWYNFFNELDTVTAEES